MKQEMIKFSPIRKRKKRTNLLDNLSNKNFHVEKVGATVYEQYKASKNMNVIPSSYKNV